ncbi:MAG: hypothetical protein LUI07_09410 [Lachnospiraceae bacterium]|nr:hypothetical protein [Lachnospiraceae bacterium]
MLTISLDEQGEFENIRNEDSREKAPLFIGGVLFDDLDVRGEYQRERKRINLYLRMICKQADAIFPNDLHVNGNGSNRAKVRDVKQLLTKTLAEFLQKGYTETIENEYAAELNGMSKRSGNYYLFAYLRFGTSMERMMRDSTSILIRDNVASNLYLHMAEEVTGRVIFHNPVIKDIRKVRFELATRRVVLDEGSEHIQEYLDLGYKDDPDLSHKKEGKRTFILTNTYVYRTAMEREMMNTEKQTIKVEKMGVKSIYYNSDEGNYRMSFLYLSDIVCSILGFKPDTSSAQALIGEFKSKADSLTGHEDNLIFAYDEVDLIFKKAWRKLEEKEYYDAALLVLKGQKMDSPYAPFYKKEWMQRLISRLSEEHDVPAYRIALQKFYASSFANDLQQDELVDMYVILESMLKQMKFRDVEEQASVYDLYDAGMTAFTHIGDSTRAKQCYDECMKYARFVKVERYLRTRDKMVVILLDRFEFDRAMEISQENVLYQEELMAVRGLIFDAEEASRHYGISLSQLGQAQTSLHLKEGEESFRKALSQMDEGTPDYLQTYSYLLHHYLEMGEKEKYDEWAKAYFGETSSLKKQFSFIAREGAKGDQARFSMKFALYVYVKGLYLFHLDDISEGLMETLADIEEEIGRIGGKDAKDQINNHPWEIIYKYLALIMLKKGNHAKADEYMAKIKPVLHYHEMILDAICVFGELEYKREKKETGCEEALLAQLAELFEEDHAEISQKLRSLNAEGGYQYLKTEILNFMYS